MTEVLESVAVTDIDQDDWVCPFSHEKAGKVKNELNGSAAALGTRLANGTSTQLWDDQSGAVKEAQHQDSNEEESKEKAIPEPHEVEVILDHIGNTTVLPFSVSAHHLIPSDASLPKSDLRHYISDGSIVDGDIGYGVNGRENGVWLPTHHALSQTMLVLPFETKKIAYKKVSKQGNEMVGSTVSYYVFAVMDRTNRQFHDDHTKATDYSNFVIKVLNKIQLNLVVIKNSKCQKCQNVLAAGGKLPPPHNLVFRLNGVSRRLCSYLLGEVSGWRLPLFTSPHARTYAESTIRFLQAMGGRQ